MPGHAKSDRAKQRDVSALEEEYTLRAVQIYQEGQGSSSGKGMSLQKAVDKAKEECWSAKKGHVKLSTSTVHRRLKGGKSRQDAADDRNWLTPEETNVVIDFAIEYADRGFPLSHRRLKEHVDQV
ncbi:hypothetical protein C8F01DRAFT_996422, partial [Mycena amicta]